MAWRDISDRKRMEVALAESESRFRLMTVSIKDYAILMLDPSGHVVTWNEGAARLKGYEESEILGHSMDCFYSPDDVASGKPLHLLEAAATNGRVEDQGWRIRKDGSRFYADVIVSAMHNSLGELIGFAKITRDITDRMELEERLRRSSIELQRFAEITAHHLQEPVGRISRYAERLDVQLSGHLNDAETQLSLQYITQQARRLRSLLRDIQRYLAADQPRGEVTKIDVAKVVSNIIDKMAYAIDRTNTKIVVISLPFAFIDQPRLLDIFEIAIDNALNYGGGHPLPRINIDGERIGSRVRYIISDNGTGIEEKYRKRVFRVFERLQSGGDGTGIGLAIVRRVVESTGGEVSISETQGGGCQLVFDLPAGEPL